VLNLFTMLDKPDANGNDIKFLFEKYNKDIEVKHLTNENGSTDYVTIKIQGNNGKSTGGTAKTLGIVGRLGGLGARPEINGFVSDGDGALAALTAALKLSEMTFVGDKIEGDVIIVTHIDPTAPTQPHDPVPFMGSAFDQESRNEFEISEEMDAIISIDTTKGNRIANYNGVAVTPTVKEGYILRVSEGILDIYENVTGNLPMVLPITTQDITPYGNGVFHINSILQPSIATNVPTIGLAITSITAIAGSGTGATQLKSVEEAARLSVEIAKLYGKGEIEFHDAKEFKLLQNQYGSLKHLQNKEGD